MVVVATILGICTFLLGKNYEGAGASNKVGVVFILYFVARGGMKMDFE